MRRKSQKRNKYADMKKHTKKRFYKRFGIQLTNEMIREAISKISSGKADFLEKQSNTRSLFLVDISGKSVIFVYNKERKMFHTCFPRSWYKNEIWNRKEQERKLIRGEE